MIADRLRAAILQAAISGKLTDQRPEDGTAKELLEQIAVERAALVKAKKLQKQKALQPVTEESQPFVIPASWEWVRFQDVNQFRIGKTPKRAEPRFWSPSEVPWVSISDMTQGGSIASTKEGVSAAAIAECFGGQPSPAGTLIMSFKLTIGRCSFLGRDAVHNEAIVSIFPAMSAGESFSTYLSHALPLLSQLGDSKAAIKGNTLNSESIANLPIPLPPPLEQERIIAKLDEVLPLIDQLAELEREREHLDREFAKAIERAILQAAVSGKLTKQRPEDGTAAELLETIKTERQQLEKEGKIKVDRKPAPFDNLHLADLPFGVPDNWMWCRLGNLAEIKSSKRVFATEFQTEGIPFFRGTEIGALATGSYTEPKFRITDAHYRELVTKTGKPDIGDLLLPSICADGRIWRVDTDRPFYFKDGRVLWVRFISKRPESRFVQTALKVRLLNDYESIASGTTFAELKIFILKNILVPVPPVAEQERIVRKLDSLLPLTRQVQELMS